MFARRNGGWFTLSETALPYGLQNTDDCECEIAQIFLNVVHGNIVEGNYVAFIVTPTNRI